MKQVGNTILAKGVNHILAKRDNSAWPKGAKLSGFSNIVLQLYGERHVCLAALKLWVEHTERWYMMGDNNLMGCLRICHCILDKGEATFMLSIELGMGHQLTFI